MRFFLMLLFFGFIGYTILPEASRSSRIDGLLIDNFENESDFSLPSRWMIDYGHKGYGGGGQELSIQRDRGNQFLRLSTNDDLVRLTLNNDYGSDLNWNLASHPRLAWDWRIHTMPPQGREDNRRLDDKAIALTVIFKREGVFRRVKGITYTFSSTLPVGTLVREGGRRMIVVGNHSDPINRWLHIERDVAMDYRQVYGETPPSRPLGIEIISDSDNTGGRTRADIDNIVLIESL